MFPTTLHFLFYHPVKSTFLLTCGLEMYMGHTVYAVYYFNLTASA